MESHPIQRTANASPAHAVEDMRIDYCRFDIAMPQQLLDDSNVRAAFEQMWANECGTYCTGEIKGSA